MKTSKKYNYRQALILSGILSVSWQADTARANDFATYTYNPSGKMIGRKFATSGEQKFTYKGQRIISVANEAGENASVDYDAEGRITRLGSTRYGYAGDSLLPCSVKDGTVESLISYNAEGRIVSIKTPNETQSLIWDGERLISRGKQCNVFDPESQWGGSPILSVSNEGVETPHVCDQVGSTLYSGQEAGETGPFGEGINTGFMTGKPFIKELGGVPFPARLYIPDLGAWNAPDPSGFRDGNSRYSYVKNPLSQFDRLGLEPSWGSYPIAVSEDPLPTIGGEDFLDWYDADWPAENFNVYKQDVTVEKGSAFPSTGQTIQSSDAGQELAINLYGEITVTGTIGCEFASFSGSSTSGGGGNNNKQFSPPATGYERLVCVYPVKVTGWKWQKRYNGMASGRSGAETGAASVWYTRTDVLYNAGVMGKTKDKEL